MLLKLGKPIYGDEAYLELRRKVMMSSMCYLSEESLQVANCVNRFLQDYEALSVDLQLAISKMGVFSKDLLVENPGTLEVLGKNREAIEFQLAFLAKYESHETFRKSHSNFFGGLPYMRGFVHWTTAFIEKANQNPEYDNYVS